MTCVLLPPPPTKLKTLFHPFAQFTHRPPSFLKLFTYITGLACACACLAMLFTFGAWLHSYKSWRREMDAHRAARASRASSTASGAPSPHGAPAADAQPAFELSEKDASLVRALRVGLRVISAWCCLLRRSLGASTRLPLCVLLFLPAHLRLSFPLTVGFFIAEPPDGVPDLLAKVIIGKPPTRDELGLLLGRLVKSGDES